MTDASSADLDVLQAAVDALDLPTAVRNGGGRYLAVNDPMAELVGLPADRIRGKVDSSLQPADLANRSAEIDGLVLGSGMPMDSDEELLCRFGRRKLRAARLPLVDGDAPWAVAVVLSDADRAADAAAARDRLAASLAAAPVAATAPPEPEAETRQREEDIARRVTEAEARADGADARAAEADARAAEAEERAGVAEARLTELEEVAASTERRAQAAEARVEELLAELHAARLDADALLRRAGAPEPASPVGDLLPATEISWGETDTVRLAAALRGAANVRAAARSLLSTMGPAAGFAAGAVWRAESDGSLRCVGAWTAPGEDVGGWETATWHASLRDGGLVVDARGAAPAQHGTDGGCPRAAAAAQAGLLGAVTFGAGDDVVVELLRRAPVAGEPLDAFDGARAALAEALERLDAADDRPAWATARL